MGLSEKLADYIIDTDYEDLPKEVVEFTKLCIIDYFSSAIAGASQYPVQKIDELVKELGGTPQASLITGGETSVTHAALLNGAASHIMEQDDIHKASIIHAATVVIPSALAVAEWKNLSGKDVIESIVIGYEVCYRIGEAVTPSHYYYWHNTATCGTFGAAAAAAKLLGLDKKQIIYALGSAGTQAAGLWEFIEDGAMSKQLHPGKAAMNGVISALLGEKNFTGASQILEGKRGFFEAMSEEYTLSNVTERLGEEFKILENSFKVHASCRHTHHVMDLMIGLAKERHIRLEDVESIRVKTYQVAIDITDNPEPDTIYASKFSMQFCTALSLLKGKGSVDTFNEDALWDEAVRALMQRIEVSVDEDIQNHYPEKWGAIAEVNLTSGERIQKEIDFPKGDPENKLSVDEILEKFRSLTTDLTENEQHVLSTNLLQLENAKSIEHLFEFAKVK
ncbi:MmgE/PrpD family protein [Oceanobacillus sp. FSL W7-1293]|uniref:MmgE/PrpD family protein n=1 Tax=Oceanobacillus sp. FSL W7-1293 TaxID=2921699 RepID=UPI0030D19529